MKNLFVFLAIIAAFLMPALQAAGLDERTLVVRCSIDADAKTRSNEQKLEGKAKRDAVAKYLKNMGLELPEATAEDILVEATKFVEEIEVEDETDFDSSTGQLSGEYTVELNTDDLNKYLQLKGIAVQSSMRIILLEEPMSAGEMGMASDTQKKLWTNYTKFQRRVRDYMIKKMSTYGLEIRLLADDDMYAEAKERDGVVIDSELVGCFWNADTNKFETNSKLIKEVKANEPDTLALYYRLDTLTIDPSTNLTRATVALSFKNLDTNVTDSIGAVPFQRKLSSTDPAMIMDDVAAGVQSAVNALLNSEDAAAKVNSILTAHRNRLKQPAGPAKVVINGEVFDAKIRKKVLYQVKKALIEAGVTTKEKVKTSNTTLNAELNPEVTDLEELYMETISPIFEELGAEIEDDKVFYGKGILQIKP